jgi:hypothetical protein
MIINYLETNLEGSACGTTEVLSQHLAGGTEEIHEIPQSRQPLFRPRFKSVT